MLQSCKKSRSKRLWTAVPQKAATLNLLSNQTHFALCSITLFPADDTLTTDQKLHFSSVPKTKGDGQGLNQKRKISLSG